MLGIMDLVWHVCLCILYDDNLFTTLSYFQARVISGSGAVLDRITNWQAKITSTIDFMVVLCSLKYIYIYSTDN